MAIDSLKFNSLLWPGPASSPATATQAKAYAKKHTVGHRFQHGAIAIAEGTLVASVLALVDADKGLDNGIGGSKLPTDALAALTLFGAALATAKYPVSNHFIHGAIGAAAVCGFRKVGAKARKNKAMGVAKAAATLPVGATAAASLPANSVHAGEMTESGFRSAEMDPYANDPEFPEHTKYSCAYENIPGGFGADPVQVRANQLAQAALKTLK